jgi:hypothetical protein
VLMRRIAKSSARRQHTGNKTQRKPVKWGLASRLPEWHAFDGRRSRIAPTWAYKRPIRLPLDVAVERDAPYR